MFDLLVKRGTVIDGTGADPFIGDIAIKDGKLIEVGGEIKAEADRIVDVKDLIVSPGFVDVHSHSDLFIFRDPFLKPKVLQGVTTEISGNCGLGPAPVRPGERIRWANEMKGIIGNAPEQYVWSTINEYLTEVERYRPAVNYGTLVPMGALRAYVIGLDDREATSSEIEEMRKLARQAIEDGAFGISLGLIYSPCRFCRTAEIIEVAKEVADAGGFMAIHVRGMAFHYPKSVIEAINIARVSGIPLHISHLMILGQNNWWKMDSILGEIEQASNDIDVSFDIFPYCHSSTMFTAILPPWVTAGGISKTVEYLNDRKSAQLIEEQIASVEYTESTEGWDNFVLLAGWNNIIIASVNLEKNKCLEGNSIQTIADQKGIQPFEVASELLQEELGSVSMIVRNTISEDNFIQTLRHPNLQAIASDSLFEGRPHPRAYGTFPRFIRRYVLEQKIIDLPRAIHLITEAPARRMGLTDRGVLKEGMAADLCIFDSSTIADKATMEEPLQSPAGIEYVIINGKLLLDGGKLLNIRPGKVLRSSQ